ncbi:MAG: class I SAM-dependent methyltransferase, partial [candidate division Zixibacteria bacterium]|nr:class I SAM-dependent methyltransferase [candidate division Zixibacteria bacterium]
MPDYSTVTETPQDKGSQEQLSMIFTRYQWAAGFCKGKKVLEVGCGAGQGLGLLAKSANLVIGGDIEPANLKFAQRHYDGRNKIKLLLFDGHKFPFQDKSLDVVI